MSVQTTYNRAPAAAYAGMLAGNGPQTIITMVNAEASLAIPFGTPVARKTSSPATDRDGILMAGSDVIAGIVVHSHDYARTFTLPDGTVAGDLSATGLVPGAELQVLTAGLIWVKVKTAVAPGDAVYFSDSRAPGAVYDLGQEFGKTADSGYATAITNASWESSSAAGGFAKLRLAAKVA